MTKTRIPNPSTFREDVTVQVFVSEIPSICAAPVLRMKNGDATGIRVGRGPIFNHSNHLAA
jgi:hypothetical protein